MLTQTKQPVAPVSPVPRIRTVSQSRGEAYAYAGLLTLAILRLWILPLRTGFWLDETGTFWAASGTLAQTFSRSIVWPSQFPLYTAIAWIAMHVGGRPELTMRLPSLFAMGVGAYLLYRLGVEMVNRAAALAAVLLFVSFEPVAFAASDARSYAIGLAAVIGAMLALVRWLESSRLAYGLAYAACVALTWQMQYVFATTFIVQVLYLCLRLRGGWRLKVSHGLAVIGTAVLLALPSAPHLQAMLRTATSHGFAGSPSIEGLFATFAPPALVCGLIAAIAIACAVDGGLRLRFPAINIQYLQLLILWALIPCLLPFAISVLSSAKIFLPRYILPFYPALALLGGIVIAGIQSSRLRLVGAAVTLAALIFSSRGLLDFSHGGDWSRAMLDVRTLAGGAPVLFRSGFPESQPFNWLGDRTRTDYLLAPLRIYPAPESTVALPFRLDSQAKSRLEEIAPWLASRDRFLLVEMGDQSYDLWIAGRFSAAGFTARTISGYGGPQDSLRLVIFQKKALNDSGHGAVNG